MAQFVVFAVLLSEVFFSRARLLRFEAPRMRASCFGELQPGLMSRPGRRSKSSSSRSRRKVVQHLGTVGVRLNMAQEAAERGLAANAKSSPFPKTSCMENISGLGFEEDN